MKEAFIIDGIRTPIGSYKGTLSAVRTDDLGALVIKEIVERNSSDLKKPMMMLLGVCKPSW